MDPAKVLIIEDNEVMARLWQMAMAGSEFEGVIALTGKDGLDKAKSLKPVAVLLDLMIPDMDGFQILRELKKGETSSIPIIVLSQLTGHEDFLEAKTLGAVEYFVKSSIQPDQLAAKIRAALTKVNR